MVSRLFLANQGGGGGDFLAVGDLYGQSPLQKLIAALHCEHKPPNILPHKNAKK